MDAIRKIEEMPPVLDVKEISADHPVWLAITDWCESAVGIEAERAAQQLDAAIQCYARDYAAQTLASKDAEIARLRERDCKDFVKVAA